MERFLRFLIRTLLEYVVLPVVLFFGLLLLSTSPLKLSVTFVVIALYWWWRVRRRTASHKNASRSSRTTSNSSDKAGERRSQTTRRPSSAAGFQQRPPHQRTERRTSGARRSGQKKTSAGGYQAFHGDQTSHFAQAHQSDDGSTPIGVDPFESDESQNNVRAGLFGDRPLGSRVFPDFEDFSSKVDPGEEMGKWIRGDPPYDHHRHDNW